MDSPGAKLNEHDGLLRHNHDTIQGLIPVLSSCLLCCPPVLSACAVVETDSSARIACLLDITRPSTPARWTSRAPPRLSLGHHAALGTCLSTSHSPPRLLWHLRLNLLQPRHQLLHQKRTQAQSARAHAQPSATRYSCHADGASHQLTCPRA